MATLIGCITTGQNVEAQQVKLFPLRQVRLLDGPFKAAQEKDAQYILAHDVDRLLAPFRREAGLPKKAEPYGNWESMGLDGHTAGHYLSALAMMYASTGRAEFKERQDYMVAELAACQAASSDGYVGGIPGGKAAWAEIAAGQLRADGFGLNGRWVPWYNLHKIFAGLRDAYWIGGNQQAREVLVKLSDWCGGLLAHLSDEQMQQMLRAEHGGMNEILADVSVMTGDQKYLTMARRFCDQKLLEPLAAGRDELSGKHANTQIPKVIGFERIATLAQDEKLHHAAEFFWRNVTEKRTVAIGGNSVNEHFHCTDDFSPMIQDRTGPETCNTYNMLRLTEQLFTRQPQGRYADYYERALFNHILSSQNPERGGFVYFTPMRPRQYRVYSQAGEGFWCCVGTGFENHAKYGEFIYAHTHDEKLLVNLFIASELQWPEKGLTLKQETRLPDESGSKLTLALAAPARFSMAIRRPQWVQSERMQICVNGRAVAAEGADYRIITREWNDGDVIDIALPMQIQPEPLPDHSDYVALRYGPVVLAAMTGKEDLKGLYAGAGRGDHIAAGKLLPLSDAPMIVTERPESYAAKIKLASSSPLEFSASDLIQPDLYRDLKLVPFYRVHDARYSIYFRVVTPEKYTTERALLAQLERDALALDQMTLDRVIPGTQQSEVDHQLKSEKSSTGEFMDRSWRDARGWFSYQMKASESEPVDLLVTYAGRDENRKFTIYIGERQLADVALTGRKNEAFYSVRYPLPADAVAQTWTVKFVSQSGSIAGGVFDIRIVRRIAKNISD